MKDFLIAALVFLCLVLLFRGCGRQGESVRIVRDTVTVVRIDTVTHTDVKWRTSEIVRVDTVRMVVRPSSDTVAIGSACDSVDVMIPISRRVFTDDTTYRAVVSGYRVALDSMRTFRRTIDRTITIDRIVTPAPKRFGIGIQAGYGVALSGAGSNSAGSNSTARVVATPYIGIGISYNFIRF